MWNWSVRMSGYDLAHQREAFVPVRHGEGDAVRLGGRCQVLLRPRARQFEGVFQDAVHAVAGEHALLADELALGALEHAPADRGVLALGVLAHHIEVDVGLGAAGERRAHAGHQLARAQVHVLVEAAADRDQQAPQRDMVRHVGPAHRAEQDRVRLRQLLHAVGRHHRAGLLVGLARPVVVRELEAEAEAARRRRRAPSAPPARSPCRCRRRGPPRSCGSSPWTISLAGGQLSAISEQSERGPGPTWPGNRRRCRSTATTDWDRDAALTTARILLEIQAINFRPEEPYTFTSGWKSPVYIDCRRIIFFPRARSKICELGVEKINRHVGYETIEAVAGGETAGIPFAAWIADRMLAPMAYVRKRPKGFGRNALIEGDVPEGKRTLLVEDLTTDGQSKIRFAQALRDAGAIVNHAFVVFFYGVFPGAFETLARMDIALHHLCTWWDVLEACKDRPYFAEPALAEVRRFLEDPVAWSAAHGGIASAEEAMARKAAADAE